MMLVSAISLCFGIADIRTNNKNYFYVVFAWVAASVFMLFAYLVFYFLDGDASLKETQFVWVLTGGLQIGISILLFFRPVELQNIDKKLKSLFGLSAVVYVALLVFGFYCLLWDDEIVLKIAKVNGDIHDGNGMYRDGFDKDVPENSYHLSLIIANLLSLVIAFLAKKANKWLTVYKWLMGVFLLYSLFVYINDGNPDMRETKYWWISLGVLAILNSFILYTTTKKELPQKRYDDNLLDDFSSLE
jgi:hypothetical protein